MFWVTDTDECYAGDELVFRIKYFYLKNVSFDDIHVEITFKNESSSSNSNDNISVKKFVPFKLIKIKSDLMEGKFQTEKEGIYRVQAYFQGKAFQTPLIKKASISDPSNLIYENFIPDFKCVVYSDFIIVNKNLILTVYSPKPYQPQNYLFSFYLVGNSKISQICTLDHVDSTRYSYKVCFKQIGEYQLHISDLNNYKLKSYCDKDCCVWVGDPSKIKLISSSDEFVNSGDIVQIVCDTSDAGPGNLTAEIIFDDKFFGFASVSMKTERSKTFAYITYIVPLIISGQFEIKLKWNEYEVILQNQNQNFEPLPLIFVAFDPKKAVVQGDGINKTILVNTEQYFTVTVNNIKCIKTIEGYIKLIEGISNKKSKIELKPDNYNTFVGSYQVERVGTYELDLTINGKKVFSKPYYIQSIDLNYINVETDNESKIINQPLIIKVFLKKMVIF